MNTRVAAFEDEVTLKGDHRYEASPSRFSVEGIMLSLRNVATLSEALRILGAGVILVSMSVFLLQGWSEGNDISRYLMLLAQTGLLGAAGFAMSHLIKETKGARLFFGLALVSIPANFTILGALLYSVFQWDGGLTTYPGYAEWRIDDLANIGITLSAAMVVLVPVTLFCFAVMARHSAKPLSMHFLLLNALLLLPIRSSLAAGTIALAGVFYALFVVNRLTRQNSALNTGEGKFALATLFIPLGIVLFRSMYFYEVDSLMVAMVGTVLFLATRQASLLPERDARLAVLLDLASIPLALIIAIALTAAIGFDYELGLMAASFSMVYTALALDVARRTKANWLAAGSNVSISVFVAGSLSLAIMANPSAAGAVCCLIGGLALFVWGVADRKLMATIAGLITLAAGACFGLEDLMRMVLTSSWIELAIFGASAITLGSLLDRHGVAMKLRVSRWYKNARKEEAPIALED